MEKETLIHNSGYSILLFYVEKMFPFVFSILALIVSRIDYLEGGSDWSLLILVSLGLFIFADAVAMPIERKGTVVTFHRLWRTSKLDMDNARFIWFSGGSRYQFLYKTKHEGLIALSKGFPNLYYVTCDEKNKLSNLFGDEKETS